MSATPLNNNATEIIDLLNLLLPKESRQTKVDFFDNSGKLKQGAIEKIAKLVQGRVSFLRDVNPKYYPSISMEGETLTDTPYLKFVRCPMSDFHYKTYKKVYTGALAQDSQYLMDFALENPESTGPNDIGIYQTNQVKKLLAEAPQKWKDKYGFDYRNDKVVGDALKYENLKKYSSKYVKLLEEVKDVIKKKQGKIFIYHNIVHISGVLFIEQMLLKNGFIDEFSTASDNTICMRCGKIRKEHSTSQITGKGEQENESESKEINSKVGGLLKVNAEEINGVIYVPTKKRNIITYKIVDGVHRFYLRRAIGMKSTTLDKFIITRLEHAFEDVSEYPIQIYTNNKLPNINQWLESNGFKILWEKGTDISYVNIINGGSKLAEDSDLADIEDGELADIEDSELADIEDNQGRDLKPNNQGFKGSVLHNNQGFKGSVLHNNQETNSNPSYSSSKSLFLHRKGHRMHWLDRQNDLTLLTIHRKKRSYYIPSSSLDNRLISCNANILADLERIFNYLNDRPIEFQIPKSAKSLLKYLINSNFTINHYSKSHIYLVKSISSNKHNSDLQSSIKEKTGGCLPCKNGSLPEHLFSGGATKKNIKKTVITDHQFTPARFIMAHSDIDKSQMEHSIEKFNSVDNADGSKYMMLVGSKIIKESYDIKAIQNVFIMSRPDNIPTLIQIRGRAVRKGSHKDLPLDKRVVHFKIFTTCLPIKHTSGRDKGKYVLSYEEEKYREKVISFQTIQQIEKVLHENAIDSYINYDLITRKLVGDHDPLSALPYNLKIDKKFSNELTADQLNLSTFNIYFAHAEIEIIKTLIKRLFIEKLSVWEYHDLFAAVKDAVDYETEINTQLFTEDNFIIALNQLVWNSNPNYIEPLANITQKQIDHESGLSMDTIEHIQHHTSNNIANTQAHMNNIIDRLYNSDDKIITLPGGQDSIITPIYVANGKKQYYVLFPLNVYTSQPEIDLELPYRVIKQEPVKTINMNSFIQTKRIDFDYDDKKKIFFRKYADISIENMQNVVCEYGTTFHIKFLDECIEYVFNAWTNPKSEKSDLHEFYFKMLYYYDLLSLVMWVYTCKPRLFKEYAKYAIPVKAKDIKLKTLTKYEKRKEEIVDISPEDNSDLATSGVINLLKTSLNRTSNVWVPAEFREQFDITIDDSLLLYSGKKKKNKNINKVSGILLPIGHYIGKFPRIYHPEKGWTEDPTYIQNEQDYIENDIIVGYDERSKTGVHIRFKLRAPIHNIKKFKDTRLIEKGTVCKSKSKVYLRQIAKKLDIIVPDKVNVDELCMLIRAKLIRFELKERIKKSKTKYFYFHYESSNPME
jgi:hypothetical protein